MNPCPVLDARTATIFLFFIAVRGRTPEATQIATGRNAARLCCVTSRDSGRSWGAARDLTEEAVGGAEHGRRGVGGGRAAGEQGGTHRGGAGLTAGWGLPWVGGGPHGGGRGRVPLQVTGRPTPRPKTKGHPPRFLGLPPPQTLSPVNRCRSPPLGLQSRLI